MPAPVRWGLAGLIIAALAVPAVPASASTGRTLIYDNEFNRTAPAGTVTGCTPTGCTGAPQLRMGGLRAGTQDGNNRWCRYYPARVVTEKDGQMIMNGHVTRSGQCVGASMFPLVKPFAYGEIDVRLRTNRAPGWHLLNMLWPVDDHSTEIDFPETNIGDTVYGVAHKNPPATLPYTVARTDLLTDGWHNYRLVVRRSGVQFWVDGVRVASTGSQWTIPDVPRRPVIRVQGWVGAAAATPPPAGSVGLIRVDWYRVYRFG